MKIKSKAITTILIGILISVFIFANSRNSTSEQLLAQTSISQNVLACKYDQCHADAKSTGKRCKHCVSNEGDLYCWQHKE